MDSQAEDARDGSPSAGDDGVDLISGLHDDVLLRILGLADARDAARTAALSRRWLRLWPRVPVLRFASRPVPRAAGGDEWRAALDEFVPFVNGVLSQRSAQSGRAIIESLSISYIRESESEHTETEQPMPAFVGAFPDHDLEQLMLVSVGAAQGWIRHAFQHGVKSLILDMPLPARMTLLVGSDDDDYKDYYSIEKGDDENKPVVLLDGLPSPTGLETMRLALGGARLRLSSAVTFASLKDLSLEMIKIADGGGARLLARLVSSASCPLLQKLRMSKLRFPKVGDEMRLEAGVLSELWVEYVSVMSLELRTPSLRVLHMAECPHRVLSLSAPRLEEFASSFRLCGPPRLLQVDGGLPRVLSLKLCVWSHRGRTFQWGQHNDGFVLLLKHCSSLTCLEVTLSGPKVFEDHVDLIKDKVPHLPQITSLTVNVCKAFERHDFGVGVANLLTRFTNLRRLSLHLPFFFTLPPLQELITCVRCEGLVSGGM
ncbi:uncharacterized protein [Setaria viridis]|uniref:uncharacterized protein n=1 Tax=Setaria viridis TaxID=4556 RepID=UPI003B3AAD05